MPSAEYCHLSSQNRGGTAIGMTKQKIIFRRVKYLEQTNRTIFVAQSSRFRIVMKWQKLPRFLGRVLPSGRKWRTGNRRICAVKKCDCYSVNLSYANCDGAETSEHSYAGHVSYFSQDINNVVAISQYTACPRRNGQNFGRVFLMLNDTDITQNTYIQSWTVTDIMAREKCKLLGCPRTVRRPWRHTRTLRMPGNQTPLANIVMQWPWRDNGTAAACVNYLET